ncbi:unnamed protein product, partial [Mesorhabditis belari]|uniref:Uncharacterized protein n=1 Tax=Mesorhabditis belari TaxID=2138241 RepID=A0AAF3FDI6_9BILA
MDDSGGIRNLKCVLVGDSLVGKTNLIVSYTTGRYPSEYKPTNFDTYSVVVRVDRKPIRLQLCDTAGQRHCALRPLCYPGVDVMLLVYSTVDPCSFEAIVDYWLPEVTRSQPTVPVVLVGTQTDRRSDPSIVASLARTGAHPITTTRGKELAQKMHCEFAECSALTQHNIKQVFDAAILCALEGKKPPRVPSKGNSATAHATRLKQGFQRFINLTKKII